MVKALIFALVLAPAAAFAQATAPAYMPATTSPQLSQILAQLDQTSQKTNLDLARLRIEKWKTNSDSKNQAQADMESVAKNLSSALPEMIAGVRANPAAVAPTFKLYRDLNVVFDVLSSLAENTGAFGPRDDYTELANDTHQLDSLRRSLADYIDGIAASRDAEVIQLRNQAAVAAQQQKPVAKQVIDDTEPAPKPKSKTKKNKTIAKPTGTVPSSPPQNQ